jgi:GDP/UDP-N,N'-diacetylbacillosamine 2-epimerase (hydrolysing)
MKKNICIVTGSRAEYSSYYPLLEAINKDGTLSVQIVVTGMHLSPKFGLTYKEIEKDGYNICEKVPILSFGDSGRGITKSIGLGVMRFADTFARLKPHMVVLIGDRFETFAAAVSAFTANIPIVHIGGGDLTLGAMDDAFRHSITKMSCLHLVSAKEHRARVIQLGEDPKAVFVTGAPCIDNIRKIKLLSKKDLERALSIRLGARNVVVTFHPVTLERNTSGRQFKEILKALDSFDDLFIIFTKSNADTNSGIIIKLMDEYVRRNRRRAVAFNSLGQLRYLSLLKYVDALVGNSSSGIAEAPSFKIGTINIGDRQKGRIKPESVISCQPARESIVKAFKKLYSKSFQKRLKNVINPYGDGCAAERIKDILKTYNVDKSLKKQFYDIKIPHGR